MKEAVAQIETALLIQQIAIVQQTELLLLQERLQPVRATETLTAMRMLVHQVEEVQTTIVVQM